MTAPSLPSPTACLLPVYDVETAGGALLSIVVDTHVNETIKLSEISGGGGPNNCSSKGSVEIGMLGASDGKGSSSSDGTCTRLLKSSSSASSIVA